MAHPNPEVQQSREFPKLSLSGLFLFGLYAREAIKRKWGDGMSFRAFVKDLNSDFGEGRSHRVLVKMANRLEYQSQKLLMNREYKDIRGIKRLAASLEEVKAVRCKRNGTMTPYGEAWCELIEHIADLYDLAVESESDSKLLATIKAQRDLLSPALPYAGAERRPEDFDTL